MFTGVTDIAPVSVALLTEGVDRNSLASTVSRLPLRRPPHGGRG